MALSPTAVLYIVIVFSFLVTSIYMFVPKDDERVHLIFFWLGCALSLLVTFLNATSLPATKEYSQKIIMAWCGLLFTAVGIIVRMAKGKTSSVANVLVMLSTVYGAATYFILN